MCAVQGSNGAANRFVALRQRDAAEEVVLSGRRPVGGIDPLERGQEPRQIRGCPTAVGQVGEVAAHCGSWVATSR
jgi:hypothetical protein